MTDPLDELMELKPTHASALLLDPVDVAERATLSARGARRRANVLLVGMSVVALAVVVAVGALFLRPTQAMPAGSPSATVSPSDAVSGPAIKGSVGVAPYTVARAAAALIVGGAQPDKVCLGDYTPGGTCTYAVKLAGLTWSMVPWRETVGSTSYARGFLTGTYDGTTFTARTVAELSAVEVDTPPSVIPAAASAKSLIACEVTVNADPASGLGNEPLVFPGLEAYWVDMDKKTYMVATSGDLGVAVNAVKKSVMGPACIGALPATGTLTDLVTAVKKLKAAKVDGVFGAEVTVQSGASIQVDVVANVPGLRERVVEVVGASIPLAISPTFVTVIS
ncbi:MAG TPA: hypothetical protein VIJ45_04965 [Coriobacteriia bacterium]